MGLRLERVKGFYFGRLDCLIVFYRFPYLLKAAVIGHEVFANVIINAVSANARLWLFRIVGQLSDDILISLDRLIVRKKLLIEVKRLKPGQSF